ncbi:MULTISPECIES: S1 RNA-binding domain-containing protein [unclassified Photobacterium]|uniref:CvfB family protein n=1 Tax=unclassified Photobacterium TaxID=2628852 RepID=UPI001B8BF0B7|nr:MULTISPECIES: S1-like domain-containing RNA-binding protein [unclassified Photobacterium]MDO6708412.1 S1-like domain-containing RNA-binding protein [Photobacterium sp. 1_MG-2023]QUJ68907.1 S1 RNA-binding domain-containing protein [Photobacterium sp. GJ3]
MIKIGQFNTLEVVKMVDFGVFLDGGEDFGNILLPKSSVPEGTSLGDTLEVFVYFDSNDEIIATTKQPLAQVGDFVQLKVVGISGVGAFVDWGLEKDLLVPFSEQRRRLEVDQKIMVRVYTDKASGRIVGSTKFNRFLDKTPPQYQVGQEVQVLIAEVSDLGYKAVIEDQHWGLIFKTESFGKLFVGKRLKAYIKEIRADGKISLSLQKAGKAKVDDLADKILSELARQGGFIALSDKSSPEDIFQVFRTSKATFKKTIGGLYKKGLIVIENGGIRLNDN